MHFPVFNLIIKTFQWHWEGFGPLDSHDLGFEPQDGYPLNQHRHVFFTNSHLTPGFSPSQGRIWGYVSLLAISLGFHCLVASESFQGRSKHFLRRVFNEVSPKRPQHQIIPRWNYAPATSFKFIKNFYKKDEDHVWGGGGGFSQIFLTKPSFFSTNFRFLALETFELQTVNFGSPRHDVVDTSTI